MKKRLGLRPFLAFGLIALVAVAACGDSTSDTTIADQASTTITTQATPTTTEVFPTEESVTTSTVAVSPEGEEPIDAPVEIVVVDGAPEGGAVTIETEIGSTVQIVVTSDQAQHVHVHGYDLFFDVTPDTPTEIVFVAAVPGVFEIELEGSHVTIGELEVS